MHYPLTDIHADFEINRPIRYQITPKKLFPQTTDGRTDRRTGDSEAWSPEKILKMMQFGAFWHIFCFTIIVHMYDRRTDRHRVRQQ